MTKSSVVARPNKPRHDFPLTPREHGRWCKLVHVKLHYFTSTAQEGARQMAACKRRPACRSHTATQNDFRPTIADVGNPYLAFKKSRMVGGAITMRTISVPQDSTGAALPAEKVAEFFAQIVHPCVNSRARRKRYGAAFRVSIINDYPKTATRSISPAADSAL